MYGIQRGLGIESFPVDLIYRPWKHAEGQVTYVHREGKNSVVFGENYERNLCQVGIDLCSLMRLFCIFPVVVHSTLPDEPRSVLLC